MRTMVAVASVLLIAVVISGCLGGDDKKETKPPVVMTGSQQVSGTGSGLAQSQPEEISSTLDVNIEHTNLISLTVNVTVVDGDEGTNPDTVSEAAFSSDGNYSGTGRGGRTPSSFQISIEWDGTNYMTSSWQFNINVTCEASNDQWPGPLIWRGIPDMGFQYTLDITYEYHSTDEVL